MIDNDVPERMVKPSKSKPRKVKERSITEGPVLQGRVFDLEVRNLHGMTNLVELVIYQEWNDLFSPPIPELHEKEVRKFYDELVFIERGLELVSIVNGLEFTFDEKLLGEP
ncbi:hypothetical protein HAX54_048509 [Datura stramonium]|uniref:Uncharacterized protein n=1 Tax=Datura stramonium TaxID=4076 RepID=A0ABS8WN47_DATST|nr:hypothetical protein [Datura stramonium]